MLDMTLWVTVCLSILVIFQKYWLPISFHEGCSSPGGGRAEYSQKGNPLQKENKLFSTRKLNSMWKAHANKSYCKWGDRWAWQPVLKMSCREKKNTLNLECVWMGVGDYWRFNGHYVCFWGKNKTKKLYSVFIYLFIVVVNWLNFSWTSPGRTECSDFLFLHSTCTYQEVVYTYHTCSFLHLTWRTEKPVEKKLTFKESSTRPLYLVFRCDHSCALDNPGHRNALENDIFLFLWLTLALTIHSP